MPEIVALSKSLGVIHPVFGGANLRLDICEEPEHQFLWHQDAPSLLGSKRMFTYWMPFTNVSSESGTVSIIPKSHTNGLMDSTDENKSSHTLTINNFTANQKNILNIEASPGDIVIMHQMLVHASYYPDKIHKPRITGILRIDDYGDHDHIALGFKTSQGGYNIHNSPEYKEFYNKN